ncbi:MAG: SLC45 family MFS transporter [Chloroflexi bacterium]|nr:SLC45 family MFS transporter [Chloroflexota bacterium]
MTETDQPLVPPPVIETKSRWYDPITINAIWFAISTRSNILTPLLLPLLVQNFVGEASKGGAYGNLRLVSLMIALLFQALAGMLSDRNTSKFGRRRPIILIAAILDMLTYIAIGVIAATMQGQAGYAALFVMVVLSMATANFTHGPAQGLIPDLVPAQKRGMHSGIKALLEVPLPLIFVSFVVSKMIAAGNYWSAIIALVVVCLVCVGLTMLVKETPLTQDPGPFDWSSVFRLALMTAAFTGVILSMGALVRWALPHLTLELSNGKKMLIVVIGLATMLIAVAAGVLLSLRIGMGEEAKKQRSFSWWVINRLAFLVGATSLSSFAIYFIQERFPEMGGNLAAKPASTLMLVVGVALLVSSLPAGLLTDKFGTKPLLVASGLLAAAGTTVVVIAPTMTVILIGGALIGLGIGIFYSANWALGTSLVPREQAGRYLGLSNLAGAGAGAIGAYIGGVIGDNTSYTLLLTIYALMFVFSIISLSQIKLTEREVAT